MQQTTPATFKMHFFLWAIRVKSCSNITVLTLSEIKNYPKVHSRWVRPQTE